MTFVFGSGHNGPQMIGAQDEGRIVVQVLSGNGVWIGKSKAALEQQSNPDNSLVMLRDGVFIGPGDGVVDIPWIGEIWMFNPDAATTTVFGTVLPMGCTD